MMAVAPQPAAQEIDLFEWVGDAMAATVGPWPAKTFVTCATISRGYNSAVGQVTYARTCA
ncbi:MAG: hypothetical protein EA405_01975 [Rhodospirillales bacterium]|nr:MAG: hypothetical protein EA405_01975 [Rhodospirillales bacterium]